MKSKPAKPVVVIVTPAWVDANNGNWRTAARWGRLLSAKHTVLLADGWPQGRLQALGRGSASWSDAQLRRLASQAQAAEALQARTSAPPNNSMHQQPGAPP